MARIKEYLSLRKTENNANLWKILRLTLLLFFLLGIFVANRMSYEWNSYYLDQVKYSQIQSGQLFFYVLEERLPLFLILLIFAATKWGVWIGLICMAWQGFAAGYLLAIEIITYGVKGLFLMMLAVFPHYFIYIPVYLVCIYWAGYPPAVSRTDKRNVYKIIMRYICIIFIFIVGILMESYVNLFLLKKIL